MNELIFCLQLAFVLCFLALAVRLGKEALIGLIVLSGVMANLFVTKQIVLIGMIVTCSDVFAVGGILGLNLLQEFYGNAIAKKTIHATLVTLVLFAILSQVHLLFLPSPADKTHEAFVTILSSSFRIVAASIAVYYVVQRLDLLVFSLLAKPIPRLGTRLLTSLLISQGLDTVLFTFFGLYGLVSSIFDVMIVSYSVKCAVIAFSSPVAALFKRFVPELKEGV